jgi:long-chain acyl-CoA synthetase
MTINGLCGIKWGALNVMITNPKDIPAFIKELKKNTFHIFPGLNTLFNGLLNNPEFASVDFSNLKITIAGGMALQKDRGRALGKSNWLPIGGRLRTLRDVAGTLG